MQSGGRQRFGASPFGLIAQEVRHMQAADFFLGKPTSHARALDQFFLYLVLRKNSVHGAGTLFLEGSHLHKVWTRMSGDFNRALTILLVEAAV